MKTRAEKIAEAEAAGLTFPHPVPPGRGEVIEIAKGVLWAQLPLPMALDHLNVYLLEDADGWTIVDTGMDTKPCREAWEALIAGPLAGKPIARVLVTHHHPDHVGLAGWLCERFDAPLIASRTAYFFARSLQLDAWTELPAEAQRYYRRAGYGTRELEMAQGRAKYGFGMVCCKLPIGFQRVQEGETLRLAGRDWHVAFGQGHAPDHLVLVCKEDGLIIGGDQVLPRITSVIGVYATEPEADPLGEWLEACARLREDLPAEALVLPGHNEPFTGVSIRLGQLIEHHEEALVKLIDFLAIEPRTAIQCFDPLFDRKITDPLLSFATSEALAHLNHLVVEGRAVREDKDGVSLYSHVDVS